MVGGIFNTVSSLSSVQSLHIQEVLCRKRRTCFLVKFTVILMKYKPDRDL